MVRLTGQAEPHGVKARRNGMKNETVCGRVGAPPASGLVLGQIIQPVSFLVENRVPVGQDVILAAQDNAAVVLYRCQPPFQSDSASEHPGRVNIGACRHRKLVLAGVKNRFFVVIRAVMTETFAGRMGRIDPFDPVRISGCCFSHSGVIP